MRGFFRMDYPREGGAGGTVVFTNGTVAGWDTGGCFFRGVYDNTSLGLAGKLTFQFPNGGTSPTGEHVSKGASNLEYGFKIENASQPNEMVLATPQGEVAIKLTKVSAL